MMRFFNIILVGEIVLLPILGQAKEDTTLKRSPSVETKASGTSSENIVVRQQSPEAPVGTPTRAIQDLETKMENYKTGSNLTPEEKAQNAKLKSEAIHGTFDIRELCRLALDKHWGGRSPAEQNSFVDLMTQLLEKKGILSKEQSKTRGKKYYVKYLGDNYLDAQKTKARTRTKIFIPKEEVDISIEYKLTKRGPEWKIFDVIVDDASLVDNYKYQFDSIIKKHGYPELVSRMRKKLQQMDSSS